MRCAWKELIHILPVWMREETDRLGRNTLQELRLRLGKPPQLRLNDRYLYLKGKVSRENLNFVINASSKFSPWCAETMSKGFLTAPGGHRIGICGTAVYKNGQMQGIRDITSLCIRVARDFPGVARNVSSLNGSILILGAPGWGKTTFLRDMIRQISEKECIGVVDERGELFPLELDADKNIDILTGATKHDGIHTLLRTMGPTVIAVDEITAKEDSNALLNAFHCGVKLLATAHAVSLTDFQNRIVYRPLAEQKVFDHLIILRPDKTFYTERMSLCR